MCRPSSYLQSRHENLKIAFSLALQPWTRCCCSATPDDKQHQLCLRLTVNKSKKCYQPFYQSVLQERPYLPQTFFAAIITSATLGSAAASRLAA